MVIKLHRLSSKPVLLPEKRNSWEAGAVFNAAAVYKDDLIHLIYRATDITSNGTQGDYINSLGYAVSSDGVNFNRLEKPVLANEVPQEARGPEDPRIVHMDGLFHMLYTGYGGRFPGDYRICYATSKNLIKWERHGIVLDETNKDAAFFPEKINGQYLMLHRRPPDIWMSASDDLKVWKNHRIVMRANPHNEWESEKIGIAGPPFKTEMGWVLIYHGVSPHKHYSLGIALFDKDEPWRVIARQQEPILVPELEWEVNGFVPNVVFSCGQVVVNDELYIYYGAADTVIGVASMGLQEINNLS
jgi:predicted GH43/DUF377 family glycosyl hydrolase